MTRRQKNYLFYIEHDYSYEILRPLQKEIQKQGDRVYWFLAGKQINNHLSMAEHELKTVKEVIEYDPQACFVPGNTIPNFIPGLKVQVFHSLEWKKKTTFRIRDCFDLYCTHGPSTTNTFNILKQKHQHFDVIETGWPKTDALFEAMPVNFPEARGPIILYAPTFSPKLTSAAELYDSIKKLSKQKSWFWIIKFHPKMNPKLVDQYRKIEGKNLKIIEKDSIAPLLKSAELMVSDTSSVIGEFALLKKPTITLNNALPDDYIINISNHTELESTINAVLADKTAIFKEVAEYAKQLHPYYDGQSSQRVLQAVTKMSEKNLDYLKPKPRNIFRHIKMRMKLNYWKF
ncbi:MAG: CDP-glycerol--glycerophosphate glycerophosphotransferase [Gammaproteobacteria bacterium]|nr:CDP-glycerol--glycerophosphate glycerophosphotransferase [Gammaproteobacteria bacterium]